jgi:alkylation response protein AidB-like acyl-CoA dehydrogenase
MYDLSLGAERIAIRDAIRDFVARVVAPAASRPSRLEGATSPLPVEILDEASRLGLRTLALPQEIGGTGADRLTECLVAEELGTGDPAMAAEFARTWRLAGILFGTLMSAEQSARFLPAFIADDRGHLAYAGPIADERAAWAYLADSPAIPGSNLTATPGIDGDWIVNGTTGLIENAPIASLVIALAHIPLAQGGGDLLFVIERGTPGLSVGAMDSGMAGDDGVVTALSPFQGRAGILTFSDCRVPAANVLRTAERDRLDDRAGILAQAINLGVGRAAFDAAVDYAKLRVQGGKPIVFHQAIGTILADAAIKLEMARAAIRRAAWAEDNPDAADDCSGPSLPLDRVSRVFTSEAVHQATLKSAEVFGAMGVMRDMPIQKYVNDTLIFLHARDSNSTHRFRIAECLAGGR